MLKIKDIKQNNSVIEVRESRSPEWSYVGKLDHNDIFGFPYHFYIIAGEQNTITDGGQMSTVYCNKGIARDSYESDLREVLQNKLPQMKYAGVKWHTGCIELHSVASDNFIVDALDEYLTLLQIFDSVAGKKDISLEDSK